MVSVCHGHDTSGYILIVIVVQVLKNKIDYASSLGILVMLIALICNSVYM